ncbi:hypothetical protein E8E12_001150 [Didymella heteroderae]|uniref:Uncharacterized protein n=1 Tax=Didymella heteroderae TaxID=1769908 RepID=A0A9P5BWJ6_9PLEO|nr:hypothetical protein E8E12_001150 [Didymella heteroderae]
MGATTKFPKLDRFSHLLADIRSGLGDRWTFYEECIDCVLDAAAKQQDTTAWFEQMQQLVEGVDKVRFSQEGIQFLLRNMGIRGRERQSRGEGDGATHGAYHSPPLSPAEKFSKPPFSSIVNNSHNNNNMAPEPVRPPLGMTPLLPLRPSTPAIAAWPPPRAPDLRIHHGQNQRQSQQREQQSQQSQQQTNQQPVIPRGKVVPFDSSATVFPGLTFPENLRDYYYPRDEITMTKNYEPPLLNPLRKASHDPVFFSSPTLKANIAELFGYTVHCNDCVRRHRHSIWQAPLALPYDPEDDDLAAWKKHSEGVADDEYHEAIGGRESLPLWNGCFDLDFD